MKIGIVGKPGSGKSTVFGILSGQDRSAAPVSPDKPRIATVKVPDERVDWLSGYYRPRKTVYTDIEFVDFAAIRSGRRPGETFSPSFLATLRTMDGLVVVLKGFDDGLGQAVEPKADLAFVDSEFILADLAVVESKVERLSKNVRKGLKEEARELELLQRVKEHLEGEKPLRSLELGDAERAALRGYAFLTDKPVAVVLNLDEEGFSRADEKVAELSEAAAGRIVLPLSARIEEEIAQLDREDQADFLEELGLEEAAAARLIKTCFELLGLIVFFTVGEDEVRAWTIRKGSTAVKAAGRIHSDLERGFIRAEVFSYEDLRRLGDQAAVKKEGLWRLEGKDYVVADGDILCIRHSS